LVDALGLSPDSPEATSGWVASAQNWLQSGVQTFGNSLASSIAVPGFAGAGEAIGQVGANLTVGAAVFTGVVTGAILIASTTRTADPSQDQLQFVVRAGAASAASLQSGTKMSINGYGFSVQTAPGVSPLNLAAAAPNIERYGQFSVTTVPQLEEIPGVNVNFPTPGGGQYHGTVNVPNPAPPGIFNTISGAFQQQSNPFQVR
jgi:hypothetical protein